MEIKEVFKQLGKVEISSDNLILAITKLIDVMHKNNLDNEAIEVLSDCGIKLEIEDKRK